MIQLKWFKIETAADGSILACEEVAAKGRAGAVVRYYEAATKAEACDKAVEWFNARYRCGDCGEVRTQSSTTDEVAREVEELRRMSTAKGFPGCATLRYNATARLKELEASGELRGDCKACADKKRAAREAAAAESEARETARQAVIKADLAESRASRKRGWAQPAVELSVAPAPRPVPVSARRFEIDIRIVQRRFNELTPTKFKAWLDSEVAACSMRDVA